MEKQKLSPGTVSKILWHFTGGPEWDEQAQKQKNKPKEPAKAYKKLCQILEGKKLKLGDYKEYVIGKEDELRVVPHLDLKMRGVRVKNELFKNFLSREVCCVADIPIQHLPYHAYRYGKFAIGFHRDALIKSKFNPVLYTLSEEKILNDFLTSLKGADDVFKRVEDLYQILNSLLKELSTFYDDKIINLRDKYQEKLDYILRTMYLNSNESRKTLSTFLAYIKSFSREEFYTVYCEREWRSINPFKFGYEDIAMIVIPKDTPKSINYFDRFINNKVEELCIPRSIPIITWEDLLEH